MFSITLVTKHLDVKLKLPIESLSDVIKCLSDTTKEQINGDIKVAPFKEEPSYFYIGYRPENVHISFKQEKREELLPKLLKLKEKLS